MTYNFGWGCLESDYWIFFLIYIESILKISPLWALAIQRSTTKEEHGQTLLRVVASVLKIHWWLQELLMQTLTYLQFVDRTQGNTVRLVICDLYWKCIYIYYKRWIVIQIFVVFIPIVYVPMGTSASNTATITFSFTDTGTRKYDMKISQIECGASTA